MASLPKPRLTFDEYIELEQRTGSKFEYCRGEAYKLPGASPAHSIIQTNMAAALVPRLAGSGCLAYSSSLRILIEPSGLYTYPDLSIICGPPSLERGMSATNPKVLFEVLSPSTRRFDCIAKSVHYRQIASIKEYILIEQDSHSIDRLCPSPDGQWELTSYRGEDAILELASVNLTIPLREIYADVPFELAEREPNRPWEFLR